MRRPWSPHASSHAPPFVAPRAALDRPHALPRPPREDVPQREKTFTCCHKSLAVPIVIVGLAFYIMIYTTTTNDERVHSSCLLFNKVAWPLFFCWNIRKLWLLWNVLANSMSKRASICFISWQFIFCLLMIVWHFLLKTESKLTDHSKRNITGNDCFRSIGLQLIDWSPADQTGSLKMHPVIIVLKPFFQLSPANQTGSFKSRYSNSNLMKDLHRYASCTFSCLHATASSIYCLHTPNNTSYHIPFTPFPSAVTT